ncbi:MAG TPA: lamin tail domain-containing protein [Verrucomicrobiales bacterium]|nr:lamin tail domain-containing protein [Verrucomicrobiales bacterium]
MMKRLHFPYLRASQSRFALTGKLSASLVALMLGSQLRAVVSLNEVDSSTIQCAPATEGFQFIELKGVPGESLNGYTLAFFNGASDLLYRVIPLDGFAIGASGYFVVGNPGVPKVDLVLATTQASSISNLPPDDDTIQPGPDAVVLYHNASNAYVPGNFITAGAPPVPKSVTTVNAAPGETRVDALLYASFTVAEDVDLKTALGVSAQFNENANGNRLTESLSKDGAVWTAQEPSPGRDNFTAFPSGGKLFLEIVDADLEAAEGSAPIVSHVKLLDSKGAPVLAPPGGIEVTLHTTDFSEAVLAPGPVFVPGTEVSRMIISIPAGSSQSADFLTVPQDDGWQDGTQRAFFVAEPPDGVQVAGHGCWLTVTDNDASSPLTVVVNEVNGYIPVGINTKPGVDANGDGVEDDSDRFIELVNAGTADLDLSAFRLAVDETTVQTFPACSILLPGQALVVFGGGTVTEGITAAFSNAIIRKAAGGLNIRNGSAVRLLNGAGFEVAGHTFGAVEGGSNSRKVDGSGSIDARYGNQWLKVPAEGPGTYDAPFFFGTIAPGSSGYRLDAARPYSTPGAKGDGTTAFVPVPASIGLTFTDTFSNTANAASVPELWGKGAAKLTIVRPTNGLPPDVSDLCVRLVRSHSNPASSPPILTTDAAGLLPDVGDSITMAATQDTVDLFLHTTDATAGNGDNTFTVAAFSSAYQNSSQSIVIRDSDASLLSFKCTSIVESAGAGASVLNISGGVGSSAYLVRSEPVGADPLAAQIRPPGSSGSLIAGAASLPIDALNDAPVASRQVRFTYLSGPAGDSRNSSRVLTVVDDGGLIELGPFINEADTAQIAPDNSDFVELTAPGGGGKSLTGFVFVVYGPAGTVVSAFELGGSFRPANDFFVLWNDSASGPGRLNTGANDWLPPSGAVAVYRGTAAEFTAGSPATCNNVIDALVFGAANTSLQDMLTPGFDAVTESAGNCVIARSPDATLASQLRNPATYGGISDHRTPGFSNSGTLSGYNAYVDRFPAAAAQTATDDTDGDGLTNLLEYFMGTNPAAFTPLPLPVVAADTATLTVDRGFDSLCDAHVLLTAESSDDLVLWTPMTTAGTDPVTFTALAPGPVLFTRLRISVVP